MLTRLQQLDTSMYGCRELKHLTFEQFTRPGFEVEQETDRSTTGLFVSQSVLRCRQHRVLEHENVAGCAVSG